MRFRVQAAVAGVARCVSPFVHGYDNQPERASAFRLIKVQSIGLTPPRSPSPFIFRIDQVLVLFVFVGVALSGCQKQEEITRYTVKKLPPATEKESSSGSATKEDTSPPVADQGPLDRDRMLAAIVPHRKMAWFFKMTGPREQIANKMGEFLALLGSLKFGDGDDAQPEWTLPEGWTSEKGNGLRFATLRMKSGDETLEATVIPLPAEDPTSADYVLSNVNRWCEQMGIPALKKSDLTADKHPENAEVKQIEVAGKKVEASIVRFWSINPSIVFKELNIK